MTLETFAAVRACSIAMPSGAVLRADDVTAGNGIVVDWRTLKSGEEIQSGGDAFDTAQFFVTLVGAEAALASVAMKVTPAPEPAPVAPRVVAYMVDPSIGGRRRSFDAGPFRVFVEPGEDDAAQAAFVERLAAFCASEGFAS